MNPQKQLFDAVAAHRRGDFDAAEAGYRAILRVQPKHFDATQLLGAVLLARGKHKEAGTLLRRAIAMQPRVAIPHNNLGAVMTALGQPEEALACFTQAVALDSNYAEAFNNRGNVLVELGRQGEALADYDRALAINANQINALQRSARILADAGRFEEAMARDAKALAATQPTAEMYLRSGNVLLHCKRHEEALAAYAKALDAEPDFLRAMINRTAVLESLGRFEEGIQHLDRALVLHPDHPELIYNKATLLKGIGRIDEACEYYRKALAISPGEPNAATYLGMAMLLKGDFASGWPLYEHRWRQQVNAGKRPAFTAPVWQGEPLEGRKILVHAEQGLGDVVQFCRYLPLLRQRGAEVVFLVAGKMCALLRSACPDIAFSSAIADAQSRAADFQIAIMSLPLVFGTTLENIPAAVSYLKPDAERVERWREKIGTHGFRVGICWQGKPDVSADPARSFPLAMLAPLASIPGVRLISLQKSEGVEQIAQCGFDIETLGDDFDAGSDGFVDTAAVMENLSLVISPDTAIAHLAGALGRPTWVALKSVPDWRWLLDREDSPWYPTMRLFRQPTGRDWEDVFLRMRSELERLASGRAQATSA